MIEVLIKALDLVLHAVCLAGREAGHVDGKGALQADATILGRCKRKSRSAVVTRTLEGMQPQLRQAPPGFSSSIRVTSAPCGAVRTAATPPRPCTQTSCARRHHGSPLQIAIVYAIRAFPPASFFDPYLRFPFGVKVGKTRGQAQKANKR
jgi:hypothetical protein